MGKLDGKVAIITGAARGQGEAHARRFVAEGASVVMSDVLDDLGATVAVDLGDNARYLHHDVGSESDWAAVAAAAVDAFDKIDILVNNAGVLRAGMIEHTTLEEYLAVISVNQVGVFLGMRAVIPAMRAAGGGSIVNISSTAGLEGIGGLGAYCSSKFAVRGITKVAALELGRDHIRVNSVHPGGIDTPMISGVATGDLDSDGGRYGSQPISRVGQPEEVTNLVVFLASNDSSYCTGAEFVIDGGMTCGSGAITIQ